MIKPISDKIFLYGSLTEIKMLCKGECGAYRGCERITDTYSQIRKRTDWFG